MKTQTAGQQTLDDIQDIFSNLGTKPHHFLEISQFEHAAQMAVLAKGNDFDEDVQIAAFLHEIGNMMFSTSEFFGKTPEKLAARWLLERGFSEKIAVLVQYHLQAKRYLMQRYPSYANVVRKMNYNTFDAGLMEMSEVEADAFELLPYFELIIYMRKWDDSARISGVRVPDLAHFMSMIENHLARTAH